MPAQQPPVIVVPGITGTALHDLYPVEPELVWTAILDKAYPRIALHPDDPRYEAIEPARIVATNPFGLVYADLIESLRHELSLRADRPTPVFGFGYDWRQDVDRTAELLEAFIGEVLERTALLPHYQTQPPTEVDLVGHSMGGLLIARYLRSIQERRRAQPAVRGRVRRVVTIATPFRGTISALHKLAMGLGVLTGPDPREREREASRTIPAVYQLLPSYTRAVDIAPAVPATSLFETAAWQASILQTLEEYRRLRKARTTAIDMLTRLLERGLALATSVNSLQPDGILPEGLGGWLPIVAIGEETHVRAGIGLDTRTRKPRFDFSALPANVRGTVDTGDKTVPFLGAVPDFLERDRLVCVTRGDLSFWEIADRVLVDRAGLHSFLPKVNHVQKLVARFLSNTLTWKLEAWRAPGVTTPAWPRWLEPR